MSDPMTKPPVAPVVTDEMALSISLDVDRLEKELDITNADYIALWLASAGKMPISFLACQIADAYDRSSADVNGELERLRAALQAVIEAHETGRFEPLQAAIETARQALAKGESK